MARLLGIASSHGLSLRTVLAPIAPISVNGAGYLASPRKDGVGYASARIEKFNFVTESRTTISATMPDTRGAMAGIGDATTAGYFAGGINYPSVYNTTQKLTYSGETRSEIGSTFTTARFNNKGFGNSSGTNGYMAGGQDLSSFYNTTRKLAFSSDTWSDISAVLSSNRSGAGTASNPTMAGYFAGGYNGSTTTSSIDKLSFTGEVMSTLSAALPTAADNLGMMSNTSYAGYIVGGYLTSIYKLAYPTETVSTLSATMPYKNLFSAYWSCPTNYAAVAGARLDPYPDVSNAIQKIDYNTETRTTFGATLEAGGETSNYGVSNALLGA